MSENRHKTEEFLTNGNLNFQQLYVTIRYLEIKVYTFASLLNYLNEYTNFHNCNFRSVSK